MNCPRFMIFRSFAGASISKLSKVHPIPKSLSNVFGENDVALHISNFRNAVGGSSGVSNRYQYSRNRIADVRVIGLNRNLPTGIDVCSIRDQQR
jgi:hypothetical protein